MPAPASSPSEGQQDHREPVRRAAGGRATARRGTGTAIVGGAAGQRPAGQDVVDRGRERRAVGEPCPRGP